MALGDITEAQIALAVSQELPYQTTVANLVLAERIRRDSLIRGTPPDHPQRRFTREEKNALALRVHEYFRILGDGKQAPEYQTQEMLQRWIRKGWARYNPKGSGIYAWLDVLPTLAPGRVRCDNYKPKRTRIKDFMLPDGTVHLDHIELILSLEGVAKRDARQQARAICSSDPGFIPLFDGRYLSIPRADKAAADVFVPRAINAAWGQVSGWFDRIQHVGDHQDKIDELIMRILNTYWSGRK